jgi:hypothetical protein
MRCARVIQFFLGMAFVPAAWSATLLNGDIEGGLSNWTSFGSPGAVSAESFAKETGTLGVWMPSFNSAHAAGMYQDVTASAGEVLLFSGNFSREANAILALLELKIEYFTSGNSLISSDTANHASALNAASASVWNTFSVGGTAPAGTAYARVVAYYDANTPANGENGASSSVFADNFLLTPEPGRTSVLMAALGVTALRRRRA